MGDGSSVAGEINAVDADSVIEDALDRLKANAHQQTDGRWLEDLTAEVAPHLRDWNVDECVRWQDWQARSDVMGEGTPSVDVGIDLVARRRDDGRYIAIQVKARKLDLQGEGERINSAEIDKFLAAASDKDVWAERWFVVNGNVRLGGHSPGKVAMSGAPVTVLNVAQAVESQHAALAADDDNESCPHCSAANGALVPGHALPDATGVAPPREEAPAQTRSCMQREAVETAVSRLRANEMADEEGIPRGEARGRIVLPCGTGKTRIALRITEELTYAGELSVVLCPSIALVAQIRREFLQHAKAPLRVMAVCSDKGVAADDEEKVANDDDPTIDRGLETTEQLKGCPVTTDADEIADWIRQRREARSRVPWSVIFGTYQSAHRVSEGIHRAGAADAFKVLVCDEAHRTAGVRRRKRSTTAKDRDREERLREFTLCHDRDAFPATYRVYQTATPRIYGDSASAHLAARADRSDFVVRQMDDQATFGVELYRRSYAEAVRNGWLSDYRIIAMAVGGQEATDIANDLVREADEQAAREAEASQRSAAGRARKAKTSAARLPSTGDYLKGMAFALAMGGAARTASGGRVPLRSCIGFLNTIARSQAMTSVLQSEAVRQWVAKQAGDPAPNYRLEHLDASSPVAARDEAKRRLAAADDGEPHGVLNVGIFGEGTDSPSLSAVAFLEPRKSPIDVVQAVGRAMRRAEGKQLGYIVVPVVIPAGVDAERHLAVSDKHEGWRELGDILQALRAHDKRIEDALPEMLTIQLPPEPQMELPVSTVVAIGRPDRKTLEYAVTTDVRERVEDMLRAAVSEDRPLVSYDNTQPLHEVPWPELTDEPTTLIVHIERTDGSTETREDAVVRHKPKGAQQQGPVNTKQTQRRAVQVANGKRGRVLPSPEERQRQRKEREEARLAREESRRRAFESHIQERLIDLSDQLGQEIRMNLLERSGLTANRTERDLNLLRDAVEEAARYLHSEEALSAALDSHFGLDHLSAPKAGKPRADGATIAALLWMNAAMLHQRIHAGGWLGRSGIESLAEIKASPEPEEALRDSWNAITRQDFLPVIEPATLALREARRTGLLGGLRRALRHLVAEAEQIAELYADMGIDHAGALFNQVMGDQSSDGAFFTRPVAADIAARLALEAIDPDNTLDWSDPNVWRDHKTVDLACGSGTLLAAVMTEMKRRAVTHGADEHRLAELQKVAVEEMLVGLDVNPVSIQLAATQLMTGNADVKYRKMGLHLMPYGPQPDGTVAAGSPELLGFQRIANASRLFDDALNSTRVSTGAEFTGALGGPDNASRLFNDASNSTKVSAGAALSGALQGPEMEDAVAAAGDARIVIMNPPFTNRTKMGEKFDRRIQQALRSRMDTLEGFLERADKPLADFLDKNSLGPRFAALADLCLDRSEGVFATVIPTTALTNTSGLLERLELARRFHIHTILTCHQETDVALSQQSTLSESIVALRRADPPPPATRVISLDRLPADHGEAEQLFDTLGACETGALLHGWGEVSLWPAERVVAGDWSAALWRSPELADAASRYARDAGLLRLDSAGLSGHSTGQQLRGRGCGRATAGTPGAFPILKGKGGDENRGSDVQMSLQATPTAWWRAPEPKVPSLLAKAGHLLITAGYDTRTSRVQAVASEEAYVGNGWHPVTGASPRIAQALAVWLNSTVARLLLMQQSSKKLSYPNYAVDTVNNLLIPDITDQKIVSTLISGWQATHGETIPQLRDGYTEVRQRWDAAVCEALGWDINEVSKLGELLANEPRIRGVAHGQWKA